MRFESTRETDQDPDVHDVVGIGFGPASLALALAVQEHNEQVGRAPGARRLDAAFVEQQPEFGWHRGMLIAEATTQVSFLRDLVTMRDPTSPRSFVNYLHTHGRLDDFINSRTFSPSRREFHDYLEWCAADVAHLVSYGTRAIALHPVPGPDGAVELLDVVVRDTDTDPGSASHGAGRTRTVRTRNLVVAAGQVPWIPPGVARGERIWHNSELLPRLAESEATGPRPTRFVVAGAGQSAAESVSHLHDRTDAEVHAVFARYGYSPVDGTPFANAITDAAAVDSFHAAPSDVKRKLVAYHANTNWSVVDPDLIAELYRRSYQERVVGRERLNVHAASRVVAVRELDDAAPADGPIEVDIEFLPTREVRTVTADAVVWATGYRSIDPSGLLGDVGAWCRRGEDGELLVDRDYRLEARDPLRAGIYLQGPTEHSHGLSSTLLSTMAVRARELLASLLARVPDTAVAPPAQPAFRGPPAVEVEPGRAGVP